MKRKTLRRKRRQRKTRKRTGGVRLASGAYGSVYAPGMLCKGEPAEVTKVFNINEDIEFTHDKAMETIANVKEISDKLKTFYKSEDKDGQKEYEKYFIIPEFCDEEPTLSEKNKEDGLKLYHIPISYNMKLAKESLAKKYRTDINRVIFIVNDIWYTYDPTEDDWGDKNTEEVKVQKTKDYRPEVEELTKKFIPVCEKVKALLDKLHDANVLHNDMQVGNVVEMKDGSYRLIDFDSSSIVKGKVTDEQRKKEMEDFVKTLAGWDDTYPDLYETLVNVEPKPVNGAGRRSLPLKKRK